MPPSRENRRRNRRSSMDNTFRNVFPPPPNLPDLSNPPPDFYRRPIPPPLTESYPSIPRLGSCRGCFRSSETETEPLSEIKLLDQPWGGFLGPGELFIIKLLFELGIPFKESSFYLPEEKRKPNTYELVTRFLKQVRESKGENYELVEIEKAVDTTVMFVYLTFTAKDGMDNVRTFQAMLGVPFGDEPIVLMEWRFKPDLAATSGA